MVKLNDVAAANALLVSLGGEDQMALIATRSFEKSIQLQERIERALAYAASAPPNNVHARQMARILDGSITVDDELSEVPEPDKPLPRRKAVESKPRRGTMDGRSKSERVKIREWIAEQGIELGRGRIPQKHLDDYDTAMAALKQHRKELDRLQVPVMEGQLV